MSNKNYIVVIYTKDIVHEYIIDDIHEDLGIRENKFFISTYNGKHLCFNDDYWKYYEIKPYEE